MENILYDENGKRIDRRTLKKEQKHTHPDISAMDIIQNFISELKTTNNDIEICDLFKHTYEQLKSMEMYEYSRKYYENNSEYMKGKSKKNYELKKQKKRNIAN